MRVSAALLLLCLALVPHADAAGRRCGDDVDGRAVPCGCGDILVSSRTLGVDDPLTQQACPGPGLLVAVPGERPAAILDLGGHTVRGSGRALGIQVVSGGAGGLTVLGPGVVRDFASGITARGALAGVRDVRASDNRADGFQLTGDGYAITNCEAARNGRSGFVLGGRRVRASGNRALDNGRLGFQVADRELRVPASNQASGNRRGGIVVVGERVRARHADACRKAACR